MQDMLLQSGISMTEGNITKQLVRFSLPIIAANLLQQIYTVIDTAVVGQFLGRDALAAIGSVGSLIFLIVGILVGLGNGVGIVSAQYFGAKDYDALKKTIHTAVLVSMIAGATMAVVGNLVFPLFMDILGFPPNVARLAEQYLRIYFIGVLPMLLYNVSIGMIRAMGDSRRPMYYLLVSGLLNILLNLGFVLVFEWGMLGIALSTVISQTLAAALALRRLRQIDERCCLRFRKLSIDRVVLTRFVRIGLPLGVQTLFFALPNLYIQAHINRFGAVAMAGVAAYFQVYGFLYMIAAGLSMATVTFVGQNAGAGNVGRIREGAKKALKLSLVAAVITSIFFAVFAGQILRIFTSDVDAISYGVRLMWMITPVFFLFATSEILSGVMRGVGKTTQVMLITGFCLGGARVLWLFFSTQVSSSIDVVFLTFPVGWVVLCIGSVLYFCFGRWSRHIGKTEALEKD